MNRFGKILALVAAAAMLLSVTGLAAQTKQKCCKKTTLVLAGPS